MGGFSIEFWGPNAVTRNARYPDFGEDEVGIPPSSLLVDFVEELGRRGVLSDQPFADFGEELSVAELRDQIKDDCLVLFFVSSRSLDLAESIARLGRNYSVVTIEQESELVIE